MRRRTYNGTCEYLEETSVTADQRVVRQLTKTIFSHKAQSVKKAFAMFAILPVPVSSSVDVMSKIK